MTTVAGGVSRVSRNLMRRAGTAGPWMTGLGAAGGMAVAYFLAARLGLALLSASSDVAVFWPASGLAVGILIISGRRVYPALVIGVVVGTVTANLLSDRSLLTAILKGLCNAGEAALVAGLIKSWFGRPFAFDDLRCVLGFATAACLGAAASAFGGAATITLFHSAAPYWDVWRTWFLSDGVGIVVVAPIVIGLAQLWREPPSRSELLEGLGVLALLALARLYTLDYPSESWLSFNPSIVVLPPLVWLLARCPPVFAIAGAFMVSILIMCATTYGIGRFGDAAVPVIERVKGAQSVVATGTIFILVLVALFAERHRSEAKLKQSNNRLQLALDCAELGTWSLHLNTGGFENDVRDRRIHGQGQEAPPKTLAEMRSQVHPGDISKLDAAFEELKHTGGSCRTEYRLAPRTDQERAGRERWVTMEGTVVRRANGRAEQLLGVTHDITERKHAEDALSQREVELGEAQRLAHIGSWFWKAEADALVASDELLRIFGLDPATQRVLTLRDQCGRWYSVEDWERLKAAVQRAMQTGVGYELELRAFRNETPIWITARGAAVRSSKGQIVGLRGTVQDITERKQAELALAERDLELRLASKAGLVGSYAYDTYTEIGQISPGYAAIHGLPEGTTEMTRSEWLARVHPEDVDRLQLCRSEALRERREEYKVDYRIVRHNGEVRWIESRVFILYGSDATVHRLNGVNIDVTERKRAEALIKESETRLADALTAGQVIAFEWDAVTGASQHSDNATDILGFDPDGLAGSLREDFLSHVHPDDRTSLKARIRELSPRSPSYAWTFRYVRPDGRLVWLEETARGEFDATGKLLRVKGLTRDITHHEQAEQALAERNAQLALAGRAARVGSYVYDVKKGTMQVSEGYAAIHGLPEETTETSYSGWRARVHPEDLERAEGLRNQAFANGLKEDNAEYRIVLSTGEVRWIERRGSISYGEDGRPERVVGVNIDVTERKRAEERQRVLVAELDHRVKNTLATVSAVVSHTRQGSRSVPDFAAVLEGRLRSMAATHELLGARWWQGVSLTELVRRELAPYAARNNTELNGPEVVLRAEAGQAMAMVLHELTTNAAKYGALSTKKGRVSIRWDRRLNGHPPRLVLEWQEIGGPPVIAPGNPSYGTSTIRDLIPYEFGGMVDLVFAPDGVRCRLALPADWLNDAADPVSGSPRGTQRAGSPESFP
jgi:PAS domain S-box-containing protein